MLALAARTVQAQHPQLALDQRRLLAAPLVQEVRLRPAHQLRLQRVAQAAQVQLPESELRLTPLQARPPGLAPRPRPEWRFSPELAQQVVQVRRLRPVRQQPLPQAARAAQVRLREPTRLLTRLAEQQAAQERQPASGLRLPLRLVALAVLVRLLVPVLDRRRQQVVPLVSAQQARPAARPDHSVVLVALVPRQQPVLRHLLQQAARVGLA